MDRREILERLQDATSRILGDEAPALTEDLELTRGVIDSLDLIEISILLEDEDGLGFDDEGLDDVTTVSQLIDLIAAKDPVT